MKILMVGLGSIGQRHLRNICKIFNRNEIELLAYRVRRLQQTFSDDMKIRDGVDLESEYGLKVYGDLDEALAQNPDVVFVTNITAKHIEVAVKAAATGCAIFIEKPVSDKMEGIEEFQYAIKKNGNIVYVGYQNRFHPCIKKVKEVLAKEIIGKIVSVDNEFSERLVTMHTYEDYRDTYMARSSMGGGPILNLQIHSLDYLQWLFGVPEYVYSVAATNSKLDIDVEDFASSIYTVLRPDGSKLPIYSHTDFLQYPPKHTLKVVGEKGRIEADLNAAMVKIIIGDENVSEETYSDFVRNDMFIEEEKIFFECVRNGVMPKPDFNQGVIGLKMALAAKKSAKENRVVRLEEIR